MRNQQIYPGLKKKEKRKKGANAQKGTQFTEQKSGMSFGFKTMHCCLSNFQSGLFNTQLKVSKHDSNNYSTGCAKYISESITAKRSCKTQNEIRIL